MTMTPAQIGEKLTEIHAAIVEKIGAQPWTPPVVDFSSGGKCSIRMYGNSITRKDSHRIKTSSHQSFEAAFIEAFRAISEIPDAETEAKRTFHKNLADVIDEGNGLNLPGDVMAPLNTSMKVMSENLLTHQTEAAE